MRSDRSVKWLATLSLMSLLGLYSCAGRARRSELAAPAGSSRAAPGYVVVDVMPRFWLFLDSARNKDSVETIRLFREMVVAEDSAVFAGFSGGPSDATLTRWLRDVQPWLGATRALDDRIRHELPESRRRFDAMFPDARWDSTFVYFMPWFFISDAGAGQLPDGRRILVFGVDDIARYRGPTSNLAPLFHHELFHLVHGRAHPEWGGRGRGPLYRALWVEGLATYVSGRLNPEASLSEIVGDSTMVARTRQQLGLIVPEIRSHLDSASASVNRNFMSASPLRSDLPPRSGYYVGMLVAERLAARYAMAGLVTLRDPALRGEIESALSEIEAAARH